MNLGKIFRYGWMCAKQLIAWSLLVYAIMGLARGIDAFDVATTARLIMDLLDPIGLVPDFLIDGLMGIMHESFGDRGGFEIIWILFVAINSSIVAPWFLWGILQPLSKAISKGTAKATLEALKEFGRKSPESP